MPNRSVKNVPDRVYRELRRPARLEGKTIRSYMLDLLRHDQAPPPKSEWLDKTRSLRPVSMDRPVPEALAEGRSERDRAPRDRAG